MAPVEGNGRFLLVSGLQPELADVLCAGVADQLGQHVIGHASATVLGYDVEALEFSEAVVL